jgi:3'(2'), 5'-bisphosphate nucleotidase
MLHEELDAAISLARRAGDAIIDLYGTDILVEQKLGADNYAEPVTAADKYASQIIVEGIRERFPEDAILSEEEIDDSELRLANNRVWIVDPLDGTAGFIRRDGDFGVQIGLAEHGVPILGVVHLPFHDRLSYAVKDQGAFVVRHGGEPERLETSGHTKLDEMTLAMSRNHPTPRLGRIVEHFGFTRIINRGSVGLKVGLIADRVCDIYIHPGPRTKLWDTCAPQVILEEAGGRFTDLFGNDIRYDRADLQNHDGIIASNGPAHDAAIERMKPLLIEFERVPHV